jgi:hypothetical protein
VGATVSVVAAQEGTEPEYRALSNGQNRQRTKRGGGCRKGPELDPEELEAVAIESKRVIDIDEFVPKKEIDVL